MARGFKQTVANWALKVQPTLLVLLVVECLVSLHVMDSFAGSPPVSTLRLVLGCVAGVTVFVLLVPVTLYQIHLQDLHSTEPEDDSPPEQSLSKKDSTVVVFRSLSAHKASPWSQSSSPEQHGFVPLRKDNLR